MRLRLFNILMFCASLGASAQSGSDAYEFLSVPVSAHSAALGGQNVSILDDDVTLVFDNPSLLSNVSDKMLSLDYTSYISSSRKLATAFSKTINERASWAIGAQVLSYGSMTETDAEGNELGEFSAKDIDVQGTFAYMLSDYWSGGVSAKVLTSSYADYSSVALGVDLGLNYCDEANGVSVSLVAQNLGGQVDPLYETHESLPFNLTFGFSKSLSNAPLRLSFTFDDITNRDSNKFIRHLIMGVDILPSRNSWIALGYNFRRANEMKLADGSHGAGFSLGAGINIKKVKIGAAWGKYHVAASSLVLNASIAL
ncbi:MAG: type IX secretion system protein PorQ [Bacteroidaceae bacterium]|nr:type IX secretion system protein PorQ [Bacteroidaceae bacterium]